MVTTKETRHHKTGKLFSEQVTQAETPLEVCSVQDQLDLLLELRCDDGSNPFKGRTEAHESRVQNIGESGRCGNVVDLYRISCPEKDYDIYLDSYVCIVSELPKGTKPYAQLRIEGADVPVPTNWILAESSTEPFRVTLASSPATGMLAVSNVAIASEAEAQDILQEIATEWKVPANKATLPKRGSPTVTSAFGNGLALSIYWADGTETNSKKGHLFAAIGPIDNSHFTRMTSNFALLSDALAPNKHTLVDYEQLLIPEVLRGDDGSIEVAIGSQEHQGREWFAPEDWNVAFSSNGLTATLKTDSGQVRYIHVFYPGVALDSIDFLRSHMGAIFGGTLVALSNDINTGLHTVVDTNGSRQLSSSIATPEGLHQFMLIGRQSEVSKPGYGALFLGLFQASVLGLGGE